MHFSRREQDKLREIAMAGTGSTGFLPDAILFGAYASGDDDKVVAVGVFQNITKHSADFHFALANGGKMSRAIIAAFCAIAFNDRFLGVDRLFFQIEDGNVPALVAALKVGASFEYRKRAGIHGRSDAIVLSMEKASAMRYFTPSAPATGRAKQAATAATSDQE